MGIDISPAFALTAALIYLLDGQGMFALAVVSAAVHELGHYFSDRVNGHRSIQMDLAEVQSQGNEWLFWAYLEQILDEDVFDAVYYYQFYNALCTVIIGTLIDEFEERCYRRGLTDAEDADEIMAAVMWEYGGKEWLETYVTSPDLYWRYVTVESSVYYVSYAISMLGALQLYSVAQEESYQSAMEVYLMLIQPTSNVFLGTLTAVGLKTPMDYGLYEDLEEMISGGQ